MKNFQTEKLEEVRALYEAKWAEYEGVEQKIQEGIEQNRKGDCVLSLGKEAAGKTVKVTQKSHAFKFGANLLLLDQLDTPEKNQEYRELFAKYFNLGTIPFYWGTDSLTHRRLGAYRHRGVSHGCKPRLCGID